MNPEPPFDDSEFTAQVIAELESLRATVQELRESVSEQRLNEQSLAKLRGEVDALDKVKARES